MSALKTCASLNEWFWWKTRDISHYTSCSCLFFESCLCPYSSKEVTLAWVSFLQLQYYLLKLRSFWNVFKLF